MTSPTNQRGEIGDKVVIPCQAVGDPEPVISWMFNEKELTFDEDDDDDGREYTQLPSGALRIETFGTDQSGDYRCKAVNMMGEVVSRPARMSVTETSSSRLGDNRSSTLEATTTTTTDPLEHDQHIPEDVTIPLNDSIILDCPERGRWTNPITEKLNITSSCPSIFPFHSRTSQPFFLLHCCRCVTMAYILEFITRCHLCPRGQFSCMDRRLDGQTGERI